MEQCPGPDRAVMEPRREPGEPVLSGPGLLLINPAEVRLAAEMAKAGGWRRYRLFHSDLMLDRATGRWLAGPAIGAPMAVICLEKLIALGGGPVISLGWCGALAPELAVGDLLVPAGAVSEEGTSGHYPPPLPAAYPACGLPEKLSVFLAEHGLKPRRGPVWTTDAPYRETAAKVARYRRQGICGVEMEYAALAAAAAFRGIDFASVLLVSDLVREDADWRPGFNRRDFRRRARLLLELLIKFIDRENKP